MRQAGLHAPTHQSRARWWSIDTLIPALVVGAFLLIEALPAQAALLALGAYTGGGVSQAALPFWWTLTLLFAFWLVGRIGRHLPFLLALTLAVLLGILGFLISLPLSPSAYAADGSAWFSGLRDDITYSSTHLNNLPGLALVIAYLGWRGFSRGLRKGKYEELLRIFIVGMVALVLALFVAAVLPAPTQAPLALDLTLLLTLEVFAGLVGLAMAKMQALQDRMSFSGVTLVAAGYDSRWLLIALGLSGGLLVVALLISLLLNFDALTGSVAALGPVGAAVVGAWNWLTNLIGAAILWIGNVLAALFGWHSSSSIAPPSAKPSGVNGHPHTGGDTTNHPVAATTTTVILLGGIAIALAALFGVGLLTYGLRYLFFRMRKPDPQQEADEERESLAVPGLLGAQVRAFFAGRRRAAPVAEDPLPRASMRWLYRETLRAATVASLGRAAAETPDEYAGRLRAAMSSAGAAGSGQADLSRDLAEMTAAYDAARYDEREPERQMQATLRQQAERIAQALRAQSRGERQRKRDRQAKQDKRDKHAR